MRTISLLATVAFATSAAAQPPASAPSQPGESSYETIAEALAAIRARPGVEAADLGQVTQLTDPNDFTLWSFTKPGHPAHPAMIRRQIGSSTAGGGLNLSAAVGMRCETEQEKCDAFFAPYLEQLKARGFR